MLKAENRKISKQNLARILSVFVVIISLASTSGCAIHKPMSELAIFHGRTSSATQSPRSYLGVSVVANTSINSALLPEQFETHPNPDDWEIDPANEYKIGGGIYYTRLFKDRQAGVSVTLGIPSAGIDVTGALSHRDFITLSASYMGGVRGIVQRKFVADAGYGIAGGIEVRREQYSFFETTTDSDAWNLTPSGHRYVSSIGARISSYGGKISTGPAGSFSFFVGYAPAVRRPLLSLGISFG